MRRALLFTWLCSSVLLAAMPARADDGDGAGLRISGYGTVGATHVSAPEGWTFRRELNQPINGGGLRTDIDSRVAVQANYALSPQVEFVGQLLGRRRAMAEKDVAPIEWAFVALRPSGDTTVRIGRMNTEGWLTGDYRNVGYAYTQIRPPVEFYMQLPSSFDGIDAVTRWRAGSTTWRLKGLVTQSSAGDPGTGVVLRIRPMLGALLAAEDGPWTVLFFASRVRFANDPLIATQVRSALDQAAQLPLSGVAAQAASLSEQVAFAGAHESFAGLGVRHEGAAWVMTAEVNRLWGHAAADSGYLMLGRRVGSVTVFGQGARTRPRTHAAPPLDFSGPLAPIVGPSAAAQFQQAADGATLLLNALRASQRSLSLGVRWDFHPQMAMKVQYDRTRVDPNGGFFWNAVPSRTGTAHVVSTAVDFVF